MRDRFVRVAFVVGEPVYSPVELRNGNLYLLGPASPTLAAAHRVLLDIEARERATHVERCDCEKCRPELYVKGG